MRKLLLVAGAILTLGAGAAHANTVTDPTGDFLASFAGPDDPDLDVTSFTVNYDFGTSTFMVGATFAGAINAAKPGLYVVGVDTGTGPIRPFGGIGEPNVIFNQALVIQKTGVGVVSGHPFTATITGDSFTALIPLSFLPSTGFKPQHYGFNLWPRTGLGNSAQIADFSPQNALLSPTPEPAAWALMLAGFGLAGASLRRRRALEAAAADA
ncbi:PEPxxWA-CTERM sorting domain-containing protein [Phenylobacterium sp.]|uniref:PEPxxWA-CTERM sorting domain-containing protein n=1 Tax=Phenylobacterium sp. TaxID=1871053 RepID=UPI0025F3C32A|nr:PEPxxWA-CTERM sorting domain-containing protein [Phenylobacterium sp.]